MNSPSKPKKETKPSSGSNWFQWLPPLLARLSLGLIFLQSGLGKFRRLDDAIMYFEKLGIPLAKVQAPMVAGLEVLCGGALLLGLFTRWATLPLIGTMVVAIMTAYHEVIEGMSKYKFDAEAMKKASTPVDDLIRLDEFFYIVVLIWLLVVGAGAVSGDRIFRGKEKKKKSAEEK